MKLQFSGSPEITASRDRVWRRLIDPRFVAASAPGVESVEVIDPTHFTVTSAFGPASMKARLTLDGEMFQLVPGTSAKMRLRGRAAGSEIDVLSTIALRDGGPGRVFLDWSASSELSGRMAGLGARLIEGIVRKMTEQFWTDFARRVGQE